MFIRDQNLDTIIILGILRNTTIEYSLDFFMCMCVGVSMITLKGLNVGTRKFNVLFHLIIAQTSWVLGDQGQGHGIHFKIFSPFTTVQIVRSILSFGTWSGR